MKIAAITDDGQTLSAHFGRARQFLVFTVEAGEIVWQQLRDKASHDDFVAEEDGQHKHGQHEPHGHHAHHEHHGHHGHHDSRGHGFGHGSGRRHARMMGAIRDCDVLLARGMGHGAHLALQEAGITPITTELKSVEEAVRAYLNGEIVDRPERRHLQRRSTVSMKEDLIKGLNQDLAAELGTVIRYTYQSSKATGFTGFELREILEGEIQDELGRLLKGI